MAKSSSVMEREPRKIDAFKEEMIIYAIAKKIKRYPDAGKQYSAEFANYEVCSRMTGNTKPLVTSYPLLVRDAKKRAKLNILSCFTVADRNTQCAADIIYAEPFSVSKG